MSEPSEGDAPLSIESFQSRLTTEEVADLCGVKPRTIISWRRTNDNGEPVVPLPWYKVGRKVFYLKSDVIAFLQSSKQAGKPS